jgi:hypothetical protein
MTRSTASETTLLAVVLAQQIVELPRQRWDDLKRGRITTGTFKLQAEAPQGRQTLSELTTSVPRTMPDQRFAAPRASVSAERTRGGSVRASKETRHARAVHDVHKMPPKAAAEANPLRYIVILAPVEDVRFKSSFFIKARGC